MRFIGLASAVATVLMVVGAAGLRADEDEQKVPLDKVPKAVVDRLKAKFPGAEIRSAKKENEDGKTLYELAFMLDGAKYEAEFQANGTIVEVEKEIAVANLPAAVTKAVKAAHPGATLKKAEEIRAGETLSYEVVIVTGKKSQELTVDPNGKILKSEAD